MKLTARTLILDLISTLRRGASMPVAALVEAGSLFGFEENNMRVTLSKLCAAGRVTHDERGSYGLGRGTAALAEELRAWRRLEREHRAWRGDWVAVQCGRLGRGGERRARERALAVLGFRELESGLYLRPDNLHGGVAAVRERLNAIAPEAGERLLVYGAGGFDAGTDRRARSLWDITTLTAAYEALLAAIVDSRARLGGLSEEETMVETFLVGGRVVRNLVVDPLLPEGILDPAPRRALVTAMRAYDELGRAAWAPFLAERGAIPSAATRSWRATHGVASRAAAQGVES